MAVLRGHDRHCAENAPKTVLPPRFTSLHLRTPSVAGCLFPVPLLCARTTRHQGLWSMQVQTLQGGAPSARQIRQFVREAAARFSGRERGEDRKVRRSSYDIEDPRAQVFRPIGDGTGDVKVALGWIDCVLKTLKEWDNRERKKGGARPLGLHGLRVIEALLGRHGGIPIDFRTGRIDPAILTIAKSACVSHSTVVRALAALKRLGILQWVRRSESTGRTGEFGPQRRQISNAYWFEISALPSRVAMDLRNRLARKRAAQGSTTPPVREAEWTPKSGKDSELREALTSFGKSLNAIPPDGEYPDIAKE
jgi:hypothetical protein